LKKQPVYVYSLSHCHNIGAARGKINLTSSFISSNRLISRHCTFTRDPVLYPTHRPKIETDRREPAGGERNKYFGGKVERERERERESAREMRLVRS
jgi:hypothetical protein